MSKRGIVLSPPFKPLITGGITCGGDPDPLELRKYLLYWDEIDYPTNNLIHISSPDIDYLEQTGHLKRTRVNFEGETNTGKGEFFIQAQEAALKKNQEDEPGSWNLGQLSGIPFYSSQEQGLIIDFELYGMLPLPSVNTPLADILEFKEQRKDELMAFRSHLDEIYFRIMASCDIPRSKNNEITKLESAIRDLNQTIDECQFRKIISSIRNTINADFSGIFGAGLGGAGLAASSVIPMSPLLVGMATVGLIISYKTLFKPTPLSCNSHLSYLNSVRSNLQC